MWNGCKLVLSRGITAEVFYDRGGYAVRVMGEALRTYRVINSESEAKRLAERFLRQILSEAIHKLGVEPIGMPHL